MFLQKTPPPPPAARVPLHRRVQRRWAWRLHTTLHYTHCWTPIALLRKGFVHGLHLVLWGRGAVGERAASPRSSRRHLLAFPSATFTLLTRTSYVCPPVCLRLPSPPFPHELPTCVPHPPPPPRPPLPLSTASPPPLSSSTFHRWNPSIRRRTLVVRQWYPGVVEGFEEEGNTHRVHFDDDEHVSLHLDRMQVRQRGARRGNERERERERERENAERRSDRETERQGDGATDHPVCVVV